MSARSLTPYGEMSRHPLARRRAFRAAESPQPRQSIRASALRTAILARQIGLPAQATGARTVRCYWPSATLREYVALVMERWLLHLIVVLVIAVPPPALILVAGYPG